MLILNDYFVVSIEGNQFYLTLKKINIEVKLAVTNVF